MITAAIIFAEAAALHEGLNAEQSQSYGAAARGGLTRAEVIISDAEINFPKVNQPNILICLTQEAYNEFNSIIRPGGLLIVDSHLVQNLHKADARQKSLPMYRSVQKEFGDTIVLNICMLGAVQALTQLVRKESIQETIQNRVPSKSLELNRQALDLGIKLLTDDRLQLTDNR